MKKSIVISIHLLYWVPKLLTVIFLVKIFAKDTIKSDLTGIMIYSNIAGFFAGLVCFYLFYFYLFPEFLAKKRILLFSLYGLMTWIILSLSIYFVVNLKIPINLFGIDVVNNARKMPLLSPITSVLYSGILGCLFKGFFTWYSDIKIKEQLVQRNLHTELALLKAQINPHFLFNTINNIDVLIQKDAKAASKYLNQLSDIMRFMLYETSPELIPLFKELEYIEKYIDLQKIRTANEKFVTLSISGPTDNLLISPAIFIPFIENAFKHSTNKKIEDAIYINLEIKENTITFTCRNVYDSTESFKQSQSGLGVELIKQRLNLLYKDKHELNIKNLDNQFEVKLKIITR